VGAMTDHINRDHDSEDWKETEVEKLRKENKKLREAVSLAVSVMEYFGGDNWERECTLKEREELYSLLEELKIEIKK